MPSAVARSARLRFACTDCGNDAPKWQGRCPSCGAWNTLVEAPEPAGTGRPIRRAGPEARIMALDEVGDGEATRRATGITEFDRVLGGGVVAGSLVLLGGDPGIGKSTMALQVAAGLGSAAAPALYCAGEESAEQVATRARRLRVTTTALRVLAETDLDELTAALERERPALAVVDSVQTAHARDASGAPGSPAQVREVVSRLLVVAKTTGVPILLVGHVTKEGAIAGPRTLEHMVDVVLFVEGERHGEHRILRGLKNRFGPAGEIGLFTMADDGVHAVGSAGRAFLDEASLTTAGAALTVACEGTRPLAVEVQALVAPTVFGLPRRTVSGFDLGRLHLLLAVLEKRGRVPLGQSDVYLNAVGGARLSEPAHDLAVVLALASSASDRPLPSDCVVLGEIGLGGEVRRVGRLAMRLGEALTLGVEEAIIPAGHRGERLPSGLRYHVVGGVGEAVALLG